MKDLSRMSRDVQAAFNKAVASKDTKDIEEYERLEDEYAIELEYNTKRRLNLYKYNNNYADC